VLRSWPAPRKIVTDQLRSYPAAKTDIPELACVLHVFVKAAARVNNRAENSHQPANANGVCVAFATRTARRPSCQASVRFGSASR
jgi:transposase-like protein